MYSWPVVLGHHRAPIINRAEILFEKTLNSTLHAVLNGLRKIEHQM